MKYMFAEFKNFWRFTLADGFEAVDEVYKEHRIYGALYKALTLISMILTTPITLVQIYLSKYMHLANGEHEETE